MTKFSDWSAAILYAQINKKIFNPNQGLGASRLDLAQSEGSAFEKP